MIKQFNIVMLLLFIGLELVVAIDQWGDRQIEEIKIAQAQFERQSAEMNRQLSRMQMIPLTATAYSPRECETDSTPFITAFNEPVRAGIIGVSRDLEQEYGWHKGDTVYLEGLGTFEVGDRMHQRWSRRVDLFHWDTEKAIEFGIKQTVGYKL